jgi:hypothetical protein
VTGPWSPLEMPQEPCPVSWIRPISLRSLSHWAAEIPPGLKADAPIHTMPAAGLSERFGSPAPGPGDLGGHTQCLAIPESSHRLRHAQAQIGANLDRCPPRYITRAASSGDCAHASPRQIHARQTQGLNLSRPTPLLRHLGEASSLRVHFPRICYGSEKPRVNRTSTAHPSTPVASPMARDLRPPVTPEA